jgi:hypothetical protein
MGLGHLQSLQNLLADFLYGGVACKLATTTNSHASLIMQVTFKILQIQVHLSLRT